MQGKRRLRSQASAERDEGVRPASHAILRRIRAAAPGAEIIVTGAWNPDSNSLRQLAPVYPSLETSIARAATGSQAKIARMLPVLNPAGSLQAQRAQLCKFTFICSKGDPHPTDAGYRAIADAVTGASALGLKPVEQHPA